MEGVELTKFINEGIDRWEEIRRHFIANNEMTAFLRKSSLVVMLDNHQLDKDEFRQNMVSHMNNGLQKILLEARFPYLDTGLISELKAHPAIKDMNCTSRASIRVVIHRRDCIESRFEQNP